MDHFKRIWCLSQQASTEAFPYIVFAQVFSYLSTFYDMFVSKDKWSCNACIVTQMSHFRICARNILKMLDTCLSRQSLLPDFFSYGRIK